MGLHTLKGDAILSLQEIQFSSETPQHEEKHSVLTYIWSEFVFVCDDIVGDDLEARSGESKVPKKQPEENLVTFAQEKKEKMVSEDDLCWQRAVEMLMREVWCWYAWCCGEVQSFEMLTTTDW